MNPPSHTGLFAVKFYSNCRCGSLGEIIIMFAFCLTDYVVIRHNIRCFKVNLKCIEEDEVPQSFLSALGP